MAAFLFFNSFGSIAVALPAIQKQFGNRLSEIQWITLMGVVTIATLSFCFGRAGSRFGQWRFYKIGVALYAAGAGLGGISTSFVQLLGARAVMALGLAMALPMSTAILAASFEPARRGQVLGLFASAIAIGRMTGPALGGFLLELGGWPWIFWMNFILGLVVTLAVLKIFRGPGETRFEVFDTWGALALLIGYPAMLIALTFGGSLGWLATPVIGSFGLATLGIASFIWIELHAEKPLIDVVIFRDPLLAGALITVVLSQLINHPIALAAPLYLQNALGASGLLSGLILAILPLSTALASPLGGRLADRADAWTVNSLGVGLLVLGIACYATLGSGSRLALVGAVLAVIGAGIGLLTPASQKIAFASVRQEDYGVLAAMLSSFGTAAGTLGITITVALMDASSGPQLWHSLAAF
ncbi:MAG TPA: MFS transporter, partial [Candidatus Limnocylindrales bacterium]|nr:MFS transporter [Candidatus Limnocylindrales bacterium]